MIRNVETGYCIHSYGVQPETLLTVATCRKTDIHFKWIWEFIKLNMFDSLIKNNIF